MTLNRAKVKNFRARVFQALQKELDAREEIKRLYANLAHEAGDDKMLLREVRQVYYQIQKHRLTKLIAERMEFHPFFTLQPFGDPEDFAEEEDDEDNNGLL